MELNKTEHFNVNWVNGMKINKNHFIEAENAFTQSTQLVNSQHVNAFNYGLLPIKDAEQSFNIELYKDGQGSIKLQLNKCIAVTPGGYLIYITNEIAELLKSKKSIIETDYRMNNNEDSCYIVLSVNPYMRIPIGDANPDEDPPRHPFVIPQYNLSIINSEDANDFEFGKYHITLGKISFDEFQATPFIDDAFIPPCSSIQSHSDLIETYNHLEVFYSKIENFAMNIIQKIYLKEQKNELANMVLSISKGVLSYIGGMLSEFRLKDKHEPPIVLVTRAVSLARVINNNLNVYNGIGKEELLNYLSNWCDVNQGTFENIIINTVELKYQHTNISESLNHISNFTNLIYTLFKKLNELEYIGKKEKIGVFVKEDVLIQEEEKPKRRFFGIKDF